MNTPDEHRRGNDDGWEWGEAHRVCLRLAYRYASNPSEAEDIAQDALLRAWRRRSTLRDADRRNQWLAAIVRNEAFRQHARVRPDLTSTLEFREGEEDERVLAAVELADLHAALQELSERDRRLLEMRYQEDLTQATIARRLGIPEGTVKVRLHRARAKLRLLYVGATVAT
ncbi:MAG TPA: sigma-70 family RNA polymerase sigma factor [Solirubrobacterales bacterium]|nr:sigma-70 family RNA polymerase sigma factor [Solirubrobacterales bacterium]